MNHDAVNWHSCFFLLLALACTSAVAVVVTGNIVRMACWLVMSLAAVAGLFFLAGADFLGAVATDGLRRRHDGAVGVRRDAHRPGTVRLDEDRRRAMDHGHVVGGALLAVLLQAALSMPELGRGPSAASARPPRRPRPPGSGWA